MAELTKNRKEWRKSRHDAGVARRSYMLGRAPIKRLHFLMNEAYRTNCMGLCCYRRLKLRLGNRRVCMARFTIVVLQGVNKSC